MYAGLEVQRTVIRGVFVHSSYVDGEIAESLVVAIVVVCRISIQGTDV